MALQIRKAERRKAKLRLGIAAPSGAGKTFGALQLALGLGGKIGMIDTEHGSGDLYANIGDYDIISLEAPYTVAKYREAIKTFEDAGYNTIIIDSLSHAWAGEGGLLDKQSAAAAKSGNSYTAWRNVTPDHNALVGDMLGSFCHIIATMRSKTDYVQEKGSDGKTTVRKVGLAPVQRDGMDYEFTVMLDVGIDHVATPSKDRTSLLDGEYFKLSPEIGKKLLHWLESGSEPIIEAKKEPPPQLTVVLSGVPHKVTGYKEAGSMIVEHMKEFDSKSMREGVWGENNAIAKGLKELQSPNATALLTLIETTVNQGV